MPTNVLGTELDRLGFPPGNRIPNPDPQRGMFSSIQCAAAWGGWDPALNCWAGSVIDISAELFAAVIPFVSREDMLMAGGPDLLTSGAFDNCSGGVF